MKRRSFLGAATVGAALAAWPAWLRTAFADDSCDEKLAPLVALTASYKRAVAAGKPLLVLVIPVDDGEKWFRGQSFGELINHGSDAQLAPLALAEVACATMAVVQKLVPNAGSGEPLMLLVESDAVPATIRRLDVTLPRETDPWDGPFEEREKRGADAADRRIAALAKLLDGALTRDAAGRQRRAANARTKLSAAQLARIEKVITERSEPPLSIADTGAALIAESTWSAPQPASGWGRSLLARTARARLKVKPVPGSHWATSSGCGTDIEGVSPSEQMMVACGMGHVPEKSRRFLYFFSIRKSGRGAIP